MRPMTIDGFTPRDAEPFAETPRALTDAVYEKVDALARRLHVEVEGIEHVPAGRALLIANHALGWDVVFAMAAIRRRTGRTVYALGEHAWWKLPYVRKLAAVSGVVDGTPRNVDELLAADQLVLVLPGGMREALKPSALRYRLLWGERYGFVRAALRNQAPLVPLATLGSDEIFALVGDAAARGKRWLGRFGLGWIPIPRPAHFVPWPHRRRLRYVIGEPVPLLFGPEADGDRAALRTQRLLIEGALHELLDRELAKRAGVTL
jgi:1-acyl-sn-glycerol-3-phosphate acyltransferase